MIWTRRRLTDSVWFYFKTGSGPTGPGTGPRIRVSVHFNFSLVLLEGRVSPFRTWIWSDGPATEDSLQEQSGFSFQSRSERFPPVPAELDRTRTRTRITSCAGPGSRKVPLLTTGRTERTLFDFFSFICVILDSLICEIRLRFCCFLSRFCCRVPR